MTVPLPRLLVQELQRLRHSGHASVLDTALRALLRGIQRDMVGVGLTPERRADVVRLIAAAGDVMVRQLPSPDTDESFILWVKFLTDELGSRGPDETAADAVVPDALLRTLAGRPVGERVWFSEVVAQVLNSVLPQPVSPGRRTLMSVLDSYLDSIPGRPVLYRGRPDWLTGTAFTLLCEEAEKAFARQHDRYAIVEYSPVSARADAYIEQWAEFKDWIHSQCGLALEPAIRKVTFQYNRSTDHLPWHIDKPNKVALNCLIMLERSEIRRSALHLYTSDHEIVEVDLDPGEVLLFKGDATPHRRTPLAEGEFARLMSIGFMLTAQQ